MPQIQKKPATIYLPIQEPMDTCTCWSDFQDILGNKKWEALSSFQTQAILNQMAILVNSWTHNSTSNEPLSNTTSSRKPSWKENLRNIYRFTCQKFVHGSVEFTSALIRETMHSSGKTKLAWYSATKSSKKKEKTWSGNFYMEWQGFYMQFLSFSTNTIT